MSNNTIIKIHKIFPTLEWTKIKSVSSGWDHNVLLLDDNFVVRIPKNNDAKKRMLVDFCLLEYLQRKISAQIPVPILKDNKSKISVYKAVNGVTMSEMKYKKLAPSQKNKFSKSVAVFLSQLHITNNNIIRHCGVTKSNISKQERDLVSNKKFIYAYLTQQEKNIIDGFMENRKKMLKKFKPTLVHGDLTSENIFVNTNSVNNIGIIDFSDATIDDPARDFAALLSYGDQFVRCVLKYYRGTSDHKIFERAQIYYQEMAIKLMALAIKGSKMVNIEDAKKMFHQRLNKKKGRNFASRPD